MGTSVVCRPSPTRERAAHARRETTGAFQAGMDSIGKELSPHEGRPVPALRPLEEDVTTILSSHATGKAERQIDIDAMGDELVDGNGGIKEPRLAGLSKQMHVATWKERMDEQATVCPFQQHACHRKDALGRVLNRVLRVEQVVRPDEQADEQTAVAAQARAELLLQPPQDVLRLVGGARQYQFVRKVQRKCRGQDASSIHWHALQCVPDSGQVSGLRHVRASVRFHERVAHQEQRWQPKRVAVQRRLLHEALMQSDPRNAPRVAHTGAPIRLGCILDRGCMRTRSAGLSAHEQRGAFS